MMSVTLTAVLLTEPWTCVAAGGGAAGPVHTVLKAREVLKPLCVVCSIIP